MSVLLLRPRWMKKLLRPFLPAVVKVRFPRGGMLALDPTDLRGPSFHIAYGYRDPEAALASYEPEQKVAVENSLGERAEKNPAPVFLDIGANIGLFTFSAKRRIPGLRAYAFEPHPRNGACLEATIAANGWGDSVSLVSNALAASEGSGCLFEDESDSGGHSIRQENMINNRMASRAVPVSMTTLDSWAKKAGIERVDCIKMDVQGAEAAVLTGGRATLEKFRPDLLIEVQHDSAEELIAVLETLSFPYEVDNLFGERGGMERFREWSRREEEKGVMFRDYLFRPLT